MIDDRLDCQFHEVQCTLERESVCSPWHVVIHSKYAIQKDNDAQH